MLLTQEERNTLVAKDYMLLTQEERNALVAKAISSTAGRIALAKAMAAPLRTGLDYPRKKLRIICF
jgi:hypothetical protein